MRGKAEYCGRIIGLIAGLPALLLHSGESAINQALSLSGALLKVSRAYVMVDYKKLNKTAYLENPQNKPLFFTDGKGRQRTVKDSRVMVTTQGCWAKLVSFAF